MHPLPIRAAMEWIGASGERTVERLDSLINHFSHQLAFPVSEDQRKAAADHCQRIYPDFQR